MTLPYVGELHRIREQAGGLLRPEDVVRAAENPASPLHPCFEWDDSKAAHQHRLEQARKLIRAVVTFLPTPDRGPIETRAFISLPSQRGPEGGYRAVVEVIRDDDAFREAAESLAEEVERLKAKYAVFTRLRGALDEMERAVRRVLPPPKKPGAANNDRKRSGSPRQDRRGDTPPPPPAT